MAFACEHLTLVILPVTKMGYAYVAFPMEANSGRFVFTRRMHVKGFIDFMNKWGVIGLAIAVIIGGKLNT